MLFRIILLLAFCCTSALATPLSPDDQQELVKQITNSCLPGRASEPANQKLTVGQLQDFCGCYARDFIDNTTAEELEKNDDNVINARAAVSLKKCATGVMTK
jgi:hypothetical protein